MRYPTVAMLMLAVTCGTVLGAIQTEEEQVVRAMITAARDGRTQAFLKTVDIPRIASNSHGECTPGTLIAIAKLLATTGELKLDTRRQGELGVVRATTGEDITVFFSLRPKKLFDRPEGNLVIVAVYVRIPSDTW